MAKRNLELKLAVRDPGALRRSVLNLHPAAAHAGVMRQVDTYFHARHGRLKLREVDDGRRAELIAYARPDRADVRASDYHVVPVADAAAMRSALGATLGTRLAVRKRRELFLWHNVRIHLDEVDGLGSFMEFEAVIGPDADEETSTRRLGELCDRLSLDKSAAIPGSYSDLLEAAAAGAAAPAAQQKAPR